MLGLYPGYYTLKLVGNKIIQVDGIDTVDPTAEEWVVVTNPRIPRYRKEALKYLRTISPKAKIEKVVA